MKLHLCASLSLAKILSDCEINNLHSLLKALICYDCCPCSASSACGSAYLPRSIRSRRRLFIENLALRQLRIQGHVNKDSGAM